MYLIEVASDREFATLKRQRRQRRPARASAIWLDRLARLPRNPCSEACNGTRDTLGPCLLAIEHGTLRARTRAWRVCCFSLRLCAGVVSESSRPRELDGPAARCLSLPGLIRVSELPKRDPTMAKLMRLQAVMEMTGKSRSSIYADPTFPRRIKIGSRSVAWSLREIEEWIAKRIEQR